MTDANHAARHQARRLMQLMPPQTPPAPLGVLTPPWRGQVQAVDGLQLLPTHARCYRLHWSTNICESVDGDHAYITGVQVQC